jgi:hypothetical protein
MYIHYTLNATINFRVESVDPPKYISAQIDELMVCKASAEALGWVDS